MKKLEANPREYDIFKGRIRGEREEGGRGRKEKKRKWSLLHASRATCPVAVVEIHLLALQDESTDAVLGFQRRGLVNLNGITKDQWNAPTRPVDILCKGVIVIV